MTRMAPIFGSLIAAVVLTAMASTSFAQHAAPLPAVWPELGERAKLQMQRRFPGRPFVAGRPAIGMRPAIRPGRPAIRPGRPGSLPLWGPPGTRPIVARPPGRLPAWGPPGMARPPGWRPSRPIVGRPLPPASWRPWRPGLRWVVATGVVTAATAARLRWCHVHTYAAAEVIYHSDVRCHRHQDWDHPSLRYVVVP